MIEKTSTSSAYYIDTFAQGSTHEMVNSSLMIMCANVFEKVTCKVSKSSIQAFNNVIDSDAPVNLNFDQIWVIRGESRASLVFRYVLSAFQNIRYLFTSPKESVIIFPFNNLFSLRAINFLNRLLKRRIIIFCHSEMEGITAELQGVGVLHKILAHLARNFFINPKVQLSDGIYFSVMGDILRQNLSNSISSTKMERFINVDHPYIFKNASTQPKSKEDLLSIGTVGTLNKLKGLDTLRSLVKRFPPALRKEIRVSVTGRVSGDISGLQSLGIETVPENSALSRAEFDRRVQGLDYILFFYPKNSYKITASGAIYDAILHGRPILALKNDYFNYIFQKFGSFGFLLDNETEMSDKLKEIIDEREVLKVDFISLRKKFTPDTLSAQLSNELIRIGYIAP